MSMIMSMTMYGGIPAGIHSPDTDYRVYGDNYAYYVYSDGNNGINSVDLDSCGRSSPNVNYDNHAYWVYTDGVVTYGYTVHLDSCGRNHCPTKNKSRSPRTSASYIAYYVNVNGNVNNSYGVPGRFLRVLSGYRSHRHLCMRCIQ